MSATYVWTLLLIGLVAVFARILVPGLPLGRWARRLSVVEAALIVVGLIGLVFHCSAMFFPDVVDAVPGTAAASNQVRELGVPSAIWYVVPSVLVLIGVRRLHPLGILLITVMLVGVGVTMYNGASLNVHLTWIAGLVASIAGCGAALVLPPRRSGERAVSAPLDA